MKKTIGVIVLSLSLGLIGTLGCEKKTDPAKPTVAPKTEKAIEGATKKLDDAGAKAVDKAAEKAATPAPAAPAPAPEKK
jgi:hypothetical protein